MVASFCEIDGQTGRSRHAVNETNPKQCECARCAAEQKIFQTCFGGADIQFVECSHDVQRETKQFEPDKNHQQFFTADEQHQADRCQKNYGKIFAEMTPRLFSLRQQNCEKCERDANNFEQ